MRLPRWQQGLLAGALLLVLITTSVLVYLDIHFTRMIDARLGGEVFTNASMVFSAPTPVFVGEVITPDAVEGRLRKALYTEGDERNSGVGTYKLAGERLEIHPGPGSFFENPSFREGPAVLEFKGGRIASITTLDGSPSAAATTAGQPPDHYELEPELVTTLFDRSRAKRRLIGYNDVPQVMVNAVLAAEDHRFFSHHGVSLYRILGAAVKDIKVDERAQGGSTLTMQLARNFFLTRRRTFRRKVEEVMLALLMEQRLTKQQIFQLYANEIYLGQRGSFSIYGFGEAADAYFNKDVRSLNLPESALLAGLIRGPNLYSPYKNPKRTTERRNYVLRRMQDDGFITAAEATQAEAAPLGLAQQNIEGNQAPFFVDMVKDQLLAQFAERDLISQSYRVYTTLDLDLQQAASDAVRAGMVEVDQEVQKRRRKNSPPYDPNQPQVALVVLDPHTGEIRALVGGRNYGVSQLNHVLARRQPGSSFKPFVYAAALSSAVDGSQPVITPATLLDDEPTTFVYEDKTYDPGNYKQEYHGTVTVREALKDSMNVATVRLAEMTGYDKVRNLAIAAGMNKDLLATPALALGSYVATPLEVAGGYTIFSNEGEYVAPSSILAVDDASGRAPVERQETTRRVLDPRVAYLMVSLMQTVINNGTAAGVRSRGFQLPAAGKTGTSHDGWFAGFTSNLLAVVWVGYDDDSELHLSGAASALPAWTEFMKRATALPDYRNVHDFTAPAGVVTAEVAANPADPSDLTTRPEVFIEGSEPRSPTLLQGVTHGVAGLFHKIFGGSSPGTTTAAPSAAGVPSSGPSSEAEQSADAGPSGSSKSSAQSQKKPGPLKKFLSIFKGHGKSDSPPPAPDDKKP
ncbi:MAG TPA: PBP1A family penicillin-binding protein [Terriglobia bacterium]|nr:PBP1A family penicillin-binding protein [Terriglobia bacterium]